MLSDGTVQIFPPLNTMINMDDQIIVIAEDDDKIILSSDRSLLINTKDSWLPSSVTNHDTDFISEPVTREATAEVERNLILGWNNKAPLIAKELDTLLLLVVNCIY